MGVLQGQVWHALRQDVKMRTQECGLLRGGTVSTETLGGEGVPLGVPESGRRRTAGTETTKERRSAELGGRGGQT